MEQQGAEFGSKDQIAIHFGEQQRFLSYPVASDKQLRRSIVPNCKCEHASQMLRAVGAILVIGMNNSFCIAVRVERVPELFKFLAELEIVVDLAIENDPSGAVLIGNWLLPTLDIDD